MADAHRIVVGIDFGTTFSAVAWAETSRPDQVEVVKNWPTAGRLVGTQVPTEIAYPDPNDLSKISWGYNINPKTRIFKWFKLQIGLESHEVPLPHGLKAEHLVEQYLSALYCHTMSMLYRRFDRGALQVTPIAFILCVPAIWSDAAKKKTEDAAIRAGLGGEHQLELISEPESAAIYTLKTLDSTYNGIRVDDRIVVCDAGGGTVDLISYAVSSIHPNLRVAECTAGTGDYCGSTYIDTEFEMLFARRMGTHYARLSPVHREQVAKNFEQSKCAFRNDPITKFWINVPTFNDLPEAGIEGGMFEITCEEMRQMFDPVVDQIIELIKAQVMEVSRGPNQANAILLVGGFGESEYLYERVHGWAAPYEIQVIQPREAATAIVRGAVLKGLEPKTGPKRTEVERRARRSYGVPTNQPFVPGKHDDADLFVDPTTGANLARNISWFIRKNQILRDEDTFRHAFLRTFTVLTPWVDHLVSSTSDIPPPRWDRSVLQHCTITSDLTALDKREFDSRRKNWRTKYYTAKYELVMGVRGGALSVALEFKGRRFGSAGVEFDVG